jgi:hypothetical protein
LEGREWRHEEIGSVLFDRPDSIELPAGTGDGRATPKFWGAAEGLKNLEEQLEAANAKLIEVRSAEQFVFSAEPKQLDSVTAFLASNCWRCYRGQPCGTLEGQGAFFVSEVHRKHLWC